MAERADVAVVGAGVMGGNLALNIADHGFRVVLFDLDADKTKAFVAEHPPETLGPGGSVRAASSWPELASMLEMPRRAVLLVPAGDPTDQAIEALRAVFEPGDVIVDGGNTYHKDTERRQRELEPHGLHLLGSGVSGGEVGARYGPSLMPSGPREAWASVEPIWTAIAAKVDPESGRAIEGGAPGDPVVADGAEPCTAYIGPGGSGHFVKMVHNGIEYADMQLISEAVHLLRRVGGMEPAQVADVFDQWNEGALDSYLVQISADLLRQTDPETGRPFVDIVLDVAGQKGTGRWTSLDALNLGVASPTVAGAVFARALSATKDVREEASGVLAGPAGEFPRPEGLAEAVREALWCSKVVAYAQGFDLMRTASDEHGWGLDYGELAKIWRGGCIIRARLLEDIRKAYADRPALPNLLLAPSFADAIGSAQGGWRRTVAWSAQSGVAAPAMASALAYYDGLRAARGHADVIQAQRDYFGSHTYERVDRPRGERYHLTWSESLRTQERW